MIGRCTGCSLHETAYQQVMTAGNCSPEECELLILADYPKPDDDITGYPLSGDQYKFLWDLLSQIGVKYQVTYLVRCIPIDKYSRRYRKPEVFEYEACLQSRLYAEMETMKPACILSFGQAPLEVLTKTSASIGDYRELAHDITVGNTKTKLLATYHPNYVLNTDNEMFYDRFVEDVVYACRHAMVGRHEGKYKSMDITADQFCRIADIWLNDPSIEYVSFDTESNGLNPLIKGAKITSFSICVDGCTGYNVFMYHPELDISDDERARVIESAKKLLTTKKVVVQHAKHEHRYVKTLWKFTPNIVDDTMYMSYILFMGYPGMKHGLKYLSGRFVSLPPWEEKINRYVDLYKTMKKSKSVDDDKVAKWQSDYPDLDFTKEEAYMWFSILKDESYYIRQAESATSDVFMWMIPVRVMREYGGMDAIAPLLLMNVLKPIINADEGLKSAYTLLVEGAEVFANIELKGVRLQDRERWVKIYEEHLSKSLESIRSYPEVQQLEQELGAEYNPASSKQSQILFYEKFQFPIKTTTKKGDPSTGEPVIIELIKEYREKEDEESQRKLAFLNEYREYKKLGKMQSAYFIGLSRFTHYNDAYDGHSCEYLYVPEGEKEEHMHPGYMLHGTITGRLSSQDPSMHTLPYRSDVKKMVVPHHHKRGGILFSSDQSQLEIRVLACVVEKYYGDSSLAQAYRENRDIHRYNAGKIFQRPEEEILDAERRFAKTISFSLLYGSSENSVAEQTGRTLDEVKQLFEQFYDAFPGVRDYINASHQFVSQHGCVRTPLGRIKYLLGALNPNDRRKYADAMRQAQNSIIQSAGSDLSLRSIVYMDKYLRANQMKSKVVAFVHDSITIDSHPGEWFESYDLLKYAMKDYNEALDWVTCPLKVDVDISDNYGDHATVKNMEIHEDGSRTFTMEGYDYVINNIVDEAKFSYEIVSDELVEEEEFVEAVGDLIAKKALNLSFDNKTFLLQTRKVRLKPLSK